MANTTGSDHRKRREALGLTQQDVVAKTGIGLATISKHERGLHVSDKTIRTIEAVIASAEADESPAANLSPDAFARLAEDVIALQRAFAVHMTDSTDRIRKLESDLEDLRSRLG